MDHTFDEILISHYMATASVTPEEDIPKIIEGRCYQAICEILDVIRDERLTDPECFMRIEEIVCILEKLGPGAGFRHDFG